MFESRKWSLWRVELVNELFSTKWFKWKSQEFYKSLDNKELYWKGQNEGSKKTKTDHLNKRLDEKNNSRSNSLNESSAEKRGEMQNTITKLIKQWNVKDSLRVENFNHWANWSNAMEIGSITVWSYCTLAIWNNWISQHIIKWESNDSHHKQLKETLLKNRVLNNVLEIVSKNSRNQNLKWQDHQNESALFWIDWQWLIWEEWIWLGHKTHKKWMYEDKMNEMILLVKNEIVSMEKSKKILERHFEEIEHIKKYHIDNFVVVYDRLLNRLKSEKDLFTSCIQEKWNNIQSDLSTWVSNQTEIKQVMNNIFEVNQTKNLPKLEKLIEISKNCLYYSNLWWDSTIPRALSRNLIVELKPRIGVIEFAPNDSIMHKQTLVIKGDEEQKLFDVNIKFKRSLDDILKYYILLKVPKRWNLANKICVSVKQIEDQQKWKVSQLDNPKELILTDSFIRFAKLVYSSKDDKKDKVNLEFKFSTTENKYYNERVIKKAIKGIISETKKSIMFVV